jgi:hypothetical protein
MNDQTVSFSKNCRKVTFYSGGVLLSAGGRYVAGRHQRSKRGVITGWSKSSRRRMRRFMLEHVPPPGYETVGVTLTIPGPVQPDDVERDIFGRWALQVQKRGWCAVWRLEVQKRGARHWHVILSVPAGVDNVAICAVWWDALKKQGKIVFSPPYSTKNGTWDITSVSSLMALPGAYEHSCNVQSNGSRGAWLRYMQDHASKGKQDQIGVAKGRHWGIIGRKLYSLAAPVSTASLTDSEYFRFLRAYHRLCRPSFPAPCVFGRRLGYRPSFGCRGETVRFSRPETVLRLVDWARSGPAAPTP